jgi:hypothetical protein
VSLLKFDVVLFKMPVGFEQGIFLRQRIVFLKKRALVWAHFQDIPAGQIFLEVIHIVTIHAEKVALPYVVGMFHIWLFHLSGYELIGTRYDMKKEYGWGGCLSITNPPQDMRK